MIHERFLATGPRGLRVCLREHHRDQPGIPLVILHGYLEQSASWDQVARYLDGRRVVAMDHRGHGRSDHVGAGGFYHFWDYVADVDAVIDDLGGEVDLLGHSMGGSVAVLVAACAPTKVRRLVLVEGTGPPDGQAGLVGQARRALTQRRAPPTHKPMADIDEAIHRMCRGNPDLGPDVARPLAERVTQAAADGRVWAWDALHRARSPQSFSAEQFMAFLREITADTLLVEGETSPFHRIPGLAERRAAVAKARRSVIHGCGHHPHYTHPEALAALVREHLDA